MYAIIADSGTQFCVREGERILIDRRNGDPGQDVTFDQVLMIGSDKQSPTIGTPTVAGAVVSGTLTRQVLGKKIHVQFYKRRKNYRRHQGHRQPMTEVVVTKIHAP